ncbi:hypothetical protein CIK58_05410 [Brevibacterium aurantiacum]|uniref:Bile acid:sodium symporter n=1 Tax=Brevibacterium aurantiacum TaxID=273384 RepID=A0A2A3YYX7_BREAU|nr:bile acid:sodium symporter [Brevibacterium sp.]PCC44335.1 hypothetical protein CIK65_01705 [Brevibacterium aurantiacum]PCC57786.1 hypothetical protein CIK58_05410 [Brevibacterium aurantiacum]
MFSHLFRGDAALNITLTAVNSVLAAFTIPVITNLAIGYFDADGELGLQLGKLLQVMIIVLVPVALGMVVRRFSRSFAQRADRPVRIFFSIVVLVVGARLLKLGAPQAIAVSMEIGIHNTTIALTIALSVLNSIEVAIAAVIYSILMYVLATAFGFAISRGTRTATAKEPQLQG